MASTKLRWNSQEEHRAWLDGQAALPQGFRVGVARLQFAPVELPTRPAKMAVTLIALDRPSPDFAAVFTRNALCGAPIKVGRERLKEASLGAIVVNNKISNVGAPDGVARAEAMCGAVAEQLGFSARQVLPSSTGVIGWQLPINEILAAVPTATAALAPGSALPAALGIMTTDLYPKVRRATLGPEAGGGSIVGIAKGAGMVEPNLATMLVYILTDYAVPRDELRALLPRVTDQTFNRISIDSDTSTSDTVVLLSSGRVPCPPSARAAFAEALLRVCSDLAEDVVRNGEGVHHVIRVETRGAPNEPLARLIGKGIVNSPLCKTAICGNDPNVGRLLAALGKQVALHAPDMDLARLRVCIGGHEVFASNAFRLAADKEHAIVAHLKTAELYPSAPAPDGTYSPPIDYPPHEESVLIEVDLGAGPATSTVIGADLSHEYVSENADYRS